jgi:hypothetical protein
MKRATLLGGTLLAASCSGCFTVHIPPPLTTEQQVQVAASGFPSVVVGIEYTGADPAVRSRQSLQTDDPEFLRASEPERAGESLLRGLRATRLFKEVDYTGRLQSSPDLIAVPRPFRSLPFHETWIWFFTLGLIPDCVTATRGYVFSLRVPSRPEAVEVEALSRDLACMGWCALVLNPFPSWASVFPEETLYGVLTLQLLAKRPDIMTLLGTGAAAAEPNSAAAGDGRSSWLEVGAAAPDPRR